MSDLVINSNTLNERCQSGNIEELPHLSAFQQWFLKEGYPRLNKFYREQEGHPAFWSLPSEERRKEHVELLWLAFLAVPYLFVHKYLEVGLWLSLISVYPSVKSAVILEKVLLFLRQLNFSSMRMLPLVGFSKQEDKGFHFAIKNVLAITDDFIETQYGVRYNWEDILESDCKFRAFSYLLTLFKKRGEINKINNDVVEGFSNLLLELKHSYEESDLNMKIK